MFLIGAAVLISFVIAFFAWAKVSTRRQHAGFTREDVQSAVENCLDLHGDTHDDERGWAMIPRDGQVGAYASFAYDYYVVRDNVSFRDEVVERLRRRNDFVGLRFEVLVAAIFGRAGFEVAPEDESDSSTKHPEFVAAHKKTRFVVAVEAKARNRRPSDRNPERVGVDDLISNAAEKAPKDKTFALFVEVAMPSEERDQPSWAAEVFQAVEETVKKRDGASPFDLVVFINTAHQFGASGELDPRKHWAMWAPASTTRVPREMLDAILTAVEQYGKIPDYDTGS
jgi:hypothetical protein